MSRHTGYQDLDEADFLRIAEANVEALNAATAEHRARVDADARLLGQL